MPGAHSPRFVLLALLTAMILCPVPQAAAAPPSLETPHAALLASVDSLIAAGNLSLACEAIAPAFAASDASSARDTPAHLELLQSYVEVIGRGGCRADSATTVQARRTVELADRLHGPTSLEAATARLNLARYTARYLRRVPDALSLADSAVALRRAALGPDHLQVAAALVLAGTYARQTGRLTIAEADASEALRIRRMRLPPDHPDIAIVLNNRALVRLNRGDYDGALEDAEAAHGIFSQALPMHHPNRLRAHQALAVAAAHAGEYHQSARTYEVVLSEVGSAAKPDSGMLAYCHGELGLVLSELRDYDRSLSEHREAERILRSLASPDTLVLRNALSNYGECLRRIGRPAEARVKFEQGLALARLGRFPSTDGEEALLENLGLVARMDGQLDSALSLLDQAIALREKRGVAEASPKSWLHRGLTRLALGDTAGARADLEVARTIADARATGGPLAASTRKYLAQIAADQADSTTAFGLALESLEIERHSVIATLRYLSERQALAYVGESSDPLDLALSLAVRARPDEARSIDAWNAVVRMRALVLDEFASRQRMGRAVRDPDLGSRAEACFAARRRIANLLYHPSAREPDSTVSRQIAEAVREAEQLEVELAHEGSRYRDLFARAEPAVDSLLRSVPSHEALVGFVRWNDASLVGSDLGRRASAPRYLAFLAPPTETGTKRAIELVDLGSAEPIEAAIAAWHRALRDAKGSAEEERRLGTNVRRLVWDPIAEAVAGGSRVLLVADGALHEVPWYALPGAGETRLLDRELEIVLLSTESDLLRPRQGALSPGSLLVVGGVDFKRASPTGATAAAEIRSAFESQARASSDCLDPGRIEFANLPASRMEALDVVTRARALARKPTIVHLTGEDADESGFRRAAEGSEWIHAATHGFYIDPACRGKAATGRGELGPTAAAEAELHPLFFSGIALAGANTRSTALPPDADGILTADELAALDLSSARAIILTGCDTGRGDYVAGQGVFGLRRSLERAGAGTVVLGLWPIHDQEAVRWSRAFYDACWTEGRTVSAAARLAMRRLRSERTAAGLVDRPALWAPFVASGLD